MINKLFSKKKKKKKFGLKKVEHVSHDWAIALLVSLIAVIVVIAINVLIFLQVNKPNDLFLGGSQGSKLIDQKLLEETLELYDKKEEIFLKYKEEVPVAPRL